MKAHIGADAESGLVHTVRGTSGHVSDIAEGNPGSTPNREFSPFLTFVVNEIKHLARFFWKLL
jgi:hypothetical protein